MPRIAPALLSAPVLSGLCAGAVIGAIGSVVVAGRLASAPTVAAASPDLEFVGDASLATPIAAEAADPAGTPIALEDHWLGRIVDAARRIGPPATSEYFLLGREGERPDARRTDEDPDGVDAFAVVALRRLERPGALLLEREVVFAEGGVRLLHTESIEADKRRLVWREFLPTGARTWTAEWRIDGDQLRTIAYGWHRPVHEWIEGDVGMVGPLEMLDRMRRQQGPLHLVDGESFAVVDPSAATVSEASVRTVDSVEATDAVASEIRRADGSLVLDAMLATPDADASYAAIESLRFGEGRAVCTPVDENEFQRRRARWRVDVVPAHEAILARIPKRR